MTSTTVVNTTNGKATHISKCLKDNYLTNKTSQTLNVHNNIVYDKFVDSNSSERKLPNVECKVDKNIKFWTCFKWQKNKHVEEFNRNVKNTVYLQSTFYPCW